MTIRQGAENTAYATSDLNTSAVSVARQAGERMAAEAQSLPPGAGYATKGSGDQGCAVTDLKESRIQGGRGAYGSSDSYGMSNLDVGQGRPEALQGKPAPYGSDRPTDGQVRQGYAVKDGGKSDSLDMSQPIPGMQFVDGQQIFQGQQVLKGQPEDRSTSEGFGQKGRSSNESQPVDGLKVLDGKPVQDSSEKQGRKNFSPDESQPINGVEVLKGMPESDRMPDSDRQAINGYAVGESTQQGFKHAFEGQPNNFSDQSQPIDGKDVPIAARAGGEGIRYAQQQEAEVLNMPPLAYSSHK